VTDVTDVSEASLMTLLWWKLQHEVLPKQGLWH